MPVLVEADATTAGVLAPTLASGTHVVTGSAEVLTWLQRRDDYVVVVGPTFDATAAAALADQVRSQHPATTVVLIRHMISPDVYARAMQHGIGAVVAADDPAALTAAVQRARQNWEAIHGPSSKGNERQGRVLTVFSPKGGVGKTTMAVNLGLALVERHASVCLLDLDYNLPVQVRDQALAEAGEVERTGGGGVQPGDR